MATAMPDEHRTLSANDADCSRKKTAKGKSTKWLEEPFHVLSLSRSPISFKLCNLRMSFTRTDLTSGINEANSIQGA
jgi:hypothetical protein